MLVQLGDFVTLFVHVRCILLYLHGNQQYSLLAFCNASQRAYAAVIYLFTQTLTEKHASLLCSKTRVAPVKAITIPRLELLSALLLARLIDTVQRALDSELK